MSEELLGIATAVARAAGVLLRDRFGDARTDVATKTSATDMVTDADRAAEALIVERLQSARPGDGILGEEGGECAGSTGIRWVVDPLDGTTNYLFKIPHWAVSIACENGEGTLAGVVYDPMRDELFAALRGTGATLNGSPVHVSDARDLSRALIATGFSYDPGERAAAARILVHVLPRVRDVRRAGAASLDLAWTACGRLDGYFESHLAPWDRAAGQLLVAEAGGIIAPMPAIGPNGPGLIAAAPGISPGLEALIGEGSSGSSLQG